MEVREMILFTVWTTSACNLRCRYCYEGTEKASNQMSIAAADDTIHFIVNTMNDHPSHGVWIVFHGGEPCMNFPVIEHVVQQIRKKLAGRYISFSITTNATLLDERKMEFLAQNMDEITVSLDGTKQTHDSERIDSKGQGTFDKALSTALLINHTSADIRVRMTVTPSNVANLFDNICFLIKCGFKTIVPAVDFFAQDWRQELFDVLEQQFIKAKQYVRDMHDPDLCVAMTNSDEPQEVGSCTGGINEFHIYPNGDIYPCVYTVMQPQYRCGNVRTGIDRSKVQELKKLYACTVSQCEGCSCYSGCISTRCKFLNEALTGNPLQPAPAVCLTQNVCISVYRHS